VQFTLHPFFYNTMIEKLVYVDTDVSLGTPGAEIDDGAALIFLLRQKGVRVVGAGSVFGNAPIRDTSLNLDRLLTWLDGAHSPQGLGAERPLIADTHWFDSWRSGYGETLAWEQRPAEALAANRMIDAVRSAPGQVVILSLGPMTNLALAVRLAPDIVPLAQQVIVMGGSFNLQNPSPEFNARCDPEAAQIVLNAGWNVHVLGLEITRRVHFSRADFASLPGGNSAVELLQAQAPGWIDRVEAMGWEKDGCALHDAVAAAYLVDETLFESKEMSVDVELAASAQRGLTRFLPQGTDRPVVHVVTGVDVDKCRDLIWSHIVSEG
jgi:inosine-uridine nucleoside N-ribohydrolase